MKSNFKNYNIKLEKNNNFIIISVSFHFIKDDRSYNMFLLKEQIQ